MKGLKNGLALLMAALITILSMPLTAFAVNSEPEVSKIEIENTSITSSQEAESLTVGGDNCFMVNYATLSAETSADIQLSNGFEYIEQNGGLYITDYTVDGQNSLEVPSEIDGKPVIGVLSLGAYNVVKRLASVTIPDSVATIGDSAFLEAYNLETLSIGSGVNYLDADMFSNCKKLSSISVSKDNPNYCDQDGIVYDKQITALIVYPLAKGENYTVPASVVDIDVLSMSIYDFVNVTFPEGSKMFVTEDGVTYNADKTKVITCDKTKSGYYDMPDTVTEIMDEAFNGCSQLTGVKISENVTSIVYGAFADCTSLAEVILPSKLTSIDEIAFGGCSALSSIDFPPSLNTIGEYAFFYSGLETLSLPDSVEEVDARAFSGCKKLTSIRLSNSLTYLSTELFYGCSSLTSVSIPYGVTSIGDSAFARCNSMTTVSIPSSVISIGDGAFYRCSSLASVTIPDSVISIGERAFENCNSLTEVQFSNSNIEIGHDAFANCPLKELHLPDGIKNAGGSNAFENTGITSLSLPESVTHIAYKNFINCANLSEIDIPSSVTSICGHAFDGTAWYNAQAVGEVYLEHVFYGFKGIMLKNTEININNGTTVIADYALEDCENLIKLTLPDSLKAIGDYAFYNCGGLTSVTIPDSVEKIGRDAFGYGYYHTKLPDFTIYGYSGTAAENYALNHGFKFIPIIDLTDSESNVIVSGDFSEETQLTVDNITATDTRVTYDISLINNGETVQPNETVTVKIPLTAGMNGAECKVYRAEIYGRYTNMNAVYQDGFMVFTTDNLSEYVVTSEDLSNEEITVTCTASSSVERGASITVTVSLKNCVPIKSMALSLVYDHDIFELESGKWLLTEALLADFDALNGNAAIAYAKETDVNGNVFQFTLKAKDSVALGETFVRVNLVAKNGSVSVNCRTEEIKIGIKCNHNFDDVWTYDEYQHWKICTANDCTEKSEAANHEFDDFRDTTCNVCGYIREVKIPISEDDPQIFVESKKSLSGKEFTVTVNIKNNPGFTYLELTPIYPSEFTLVSVENGELISDLTQGNQYIWVADNNVCDDGILMTFTFTTEDNIDPGNYEVGFIVRDCVNYDEQNVEIYAVNGVVNIVNFLYGDANGDKEINGQDIVRIKKYLANYDYDTNTSTVEISAGADANGDGVISGHDVVRLKKYLANYDYDTDTSTIVLGPQS